MRFTKSCDRTLCADDAENKRAKIPAFELDALDVRQSGSAERVSPERAGMPGRGEVSGMLVN